MAARSINKVSNGITLAHSLEALRREAAPIPIRTVKTIKPAIELWNLILKLLFIFSCHQKYGISAFPERRPDCHPFYNCRAVRGEVYDVGLIQCQAAMQGIHGNHACLPGVTKQTSVCFYVNCRPSGTGSPSAIFETLSLRNSSLLRCRISSSMILTAFVLSSAPACNDSGFSLRTRKACRR
jgi:hypothetical protein